MEILSWAERSQLEELMLRNRSLGRCVSFMCSQKVCLLGAAHTPALHQGQLDTRGCAEQSYIQLFLATSLLSPKVCILLFFF
jgi:hypothetical protein